jgi:hypothetical protein
MGLSALGVYRSRMFWPNRCPGPHIGNVRRMQISGLFQTSGTVHQLSRFWVFVLGSHVEIPAYFVCCETDIPTVACSVSQVLCIIVTALFYLLT